MKLVLIALLLSLFIASSAHAQWYVEGFFGTGFTSQTGGALVAKVPFEIDPNRPADIVSSVDFGPGVGVGAALGYRFTRHFRVEVNVNTEYDVIDPIDFPTIPDVFAIEPSKADLLTVTPMANFYFDYPIGESRFTPYVGIGAGAAYTRTTTRTGTELIIDDSDVGMALNVLGGVAVRVIRNLDATLGYRYLRTLATHNYDASVPGSIILGRHDRLEFNMQTHHLTVGLRYSFGDGDDDDSDG